MTILFMGMVNGTHPTTTTGEIMTTATLETYLPRERLNGLRSRQPRRFPSGRLWPHGEWSLGYAKARPDGGEWHEDPYVGLGVDDVPSGRDVATEVATLNLSDASNSHKPAKRGRNGMTGYGQQMIKACGYLMGKQWRGYRLTFGTITLPPLLPHQRAWVAANWAELTRQLLQHLARKLRRQGLPQVVCSVTEVQPKRLQSLGEGYLHWHLLWLNFPAKHGKWAVDPVELRSWLSTLFMRKIPEYQGGHVNVNVKRVKGEAARYMAKYMSKGKQAVAEAMEDWGEDACPSTWWNMTARARLLVKRNTAQGADVGELLESLLQYAWNTEVDSVYAFLKHIEVDLDGVSVTIGWRGRVHDHIRDDLTAMLESRH